jgi:transposase InsO family protein
MAAKAIIASDFFVVVTATFRLVYVFVIIEVASRRVLHFNATHHPTADWTLQQLRECIVGDEGYRFIIHDRDRIYSRELDSSLKTLGLTVVKTPRKTPQANGIFERWIGSARRECLDFMIPISDTHIRQMLRCWVDHYNRARPHSSLGPGTPDPSSPKAELQEQRHCIPKDCRVVATSILGGLHHEYRLEKIAA